MIDYSILGFLIGLDSQHAYAKAERGYITDARFVKIIPNKLNKQLDFHLRGCCNQFRFIIEG
jgi:hypothetical protein